MRIIDSIEEMRDFTRGEKKFDRSTGFVPTMGYLHDGHLSLCARSVDENDSTVMSIFVNPTQFGPEEDLEKYPRDMDGDLQKAEEAGVDVVFTPSVEEMYGTGSITSIFVPGLSEQLCGMSRGSGHFRGVCTVVAKLFNIVMPDRAYFGQKDVQQFVIINRMVQDLNLPVNVVVCPIVREEDGLAMSSRNSYLSEEERKSAPVLYRALTTARNMMHGGEVHSMVLQEAMHEEILTEPTVEVDHLDIIDPTALREVAYIDDTVIIAGAVKLGPTRLIDNLIIHPEKGPWEDQ